MNVINFKKTKMKPFFAEITLGLEKGYSGENLDQLSVIKFIQNHQESLINKKNIYLSISISECKIILSGQLESHLKLNFINYPKFPLKEDILKYEIEYLTKSLMFVFNQNRIVIQYIDETIMFENSIDIDPRIKQNKH